MQFTLRQLLGAVTLISIALSLVMYATREYCERLAIRSELMSIGAYSVGFGEENSIVSAAFHEPVASTDIARFKKFAVLDFKGADVTSESLDNLAGLEHVGMMLLILCDVQDEHLPPLEKIGGIRILSLCHTRITDASIDTIAEIPGLEWVDVSDTLITQDGIDRLRAARPSIKIEPLFRSSQPQAGNSTRSQEEDVPTDPIAT